MNQVLKQFSVWTTFGMLIVVLMGALVTNTGSADGCGTSWPLCYGQVIPEGGDHKTWIEYSHRVVSALLGVMVVALAIWSWLRFPRIREVKVLAVMAVFFIVLQGLLGAGAVIWQQSSFVLALHFGFSIISYASVLLLTIVIFERLNSDKPYVPQLPRRFRIHIFALTVYTYVVVYTGAFVRHSDSGLGCGGTWPLCDGRLIPDLASRAGVEFIHRVAAALVFIWVLALLIWAFRTYRNDTRLCNSLLIAFFLIVGQIIAGAFMVLTGLDLTLLLLHAFFITLFFGVLCYLFMIAARVKT